MKQKFILLQKIILVSASAVIAFGACKKKAEVVPDTAMVLFKHAAPDMASIDITVDGKKVNTSTLSYGNNTGYLKVNAGSRNIKATTATGVTLTNTTVSLVKDRNNSLFIANRSANVENLMLDDLLLGTPAANKAYIRILNLCPDGPAFTANMTGSNTNVFTNASFKTATAFVALDAVAAGTNVSLQIKNPSTQAVVTTVSASLVAGKVYTIILRGFVTPPSGNTNTISSVVINNK